MRRTRWEHVYHALCCASPLPAWTTEEDLIRALEELDADQDCGMITPERVWQLLPEWRAAALRFRCLEAYEPLEARAIAAISLEGLLEYQLRCLHYAAGKPAHVQRQLDWLTRAVHQKCTQLTITLNSQPYQDALRQAMRNTRSAAPLAA